MTRTFKWRDGGISYLTAPSWNEEWVRTIRSIRRNTENPEWYVQYIIEQWRKAGLPELEGVD